MQVLTQWFIEDKVRHSYPTWNLKAKKEKQTKIQQTKQDKTPLFKTLETNFQIRSKKKLPFKGAGKDDSKDKLTYVNPKIPCREDFWSCQRK